jgi:AGZA family xanthine/uracil permease-like MFS transporter
MLERSFELGKHGTNVRTEVLAGITTFMTMAYIIFENPAILADAGVDKGAVFVATCLASAFGSASMGFFANYPSAGPTASLAAWVIVGKRLWAQCFCPGCYS